MMGSHKQGRLHLRAVTLKLNRSRALDTQLH